MAQKRPRELLTNRASGCKTLGRLKLQEAQGGHTDASRDSSSIVVARGSPEAPLDVCGTALFDGSRCANNSPAVRRRRPYSALRAGCHAYGRGAARRRAQNAGDTTSAQK